MKKMRTTISGQALRRAIVTSRLLQVAKTSLALCVLLIALFGMAGEAEAQTSSNPGLRLADFNNDGIPDVLVPSPATASFTLSFGSVPFGTFSAVSKSVPYPAACTAALTTGTAIGDFNGDGIPDLAITCTHSPAEFVSYTTYILLGVGDGSFTAGTSFASLPNLVAGDFNHDGKIDLVAAGPTGHTDGQSVYFFAGAGDGTFAAPAQTTVAATAYTAMLAVDLDGDGYPDLVLGNFTNQTSNTLDIYRNNTDGTFGVAQTTATPNASIAVGAAPASTDIAILSGSFFGTGLTDLAVVDTGTNPGLFIIQNNSTDGVALGTATKTAYPGLTGAAVASFTSTLSDLLVATATKLSVLANNGTGTFAPTYAGLTVANASTLFAAADANGDGHADIYTADLTATGAILSVDLVSGTASASSMPFTLPAGSAPVSAAWQGSINFIGSTLNGTQTVGGLLPSITWPTPAAITYGTPLGAAQLDATATNALGAVVPGTFVYTPAAGTVLGVGTQTLNVVFTPTDLVAFTVATGTDTILVNQATPVITWVPDPDTIVALMPLTAAQLDATSSVPGTFVYTPALGAMLPSGAQLLSAVFTPTDAVDYKTVTVTAPLTVTTAGLALSTKMISFGSEPVGTSSATQVVTITNMNATVINIAQIALEAGANAPDFIQTNNCPAALAAGASCQITISFTPRNVGLRTAGLIINDDSTPPAQGVNVSGTGTGGILQVNPGNLKTIAGNGTAGYTGDSGLATAAELQSPNGIAFDSKGNLYITDILDAVVRKVDASGNITTFAGTGTAGYSGNGGPAASAQLNQPFSVTVDSADNVYIQDTGNYVIRKVDASGTITTFAGTGQPGHSGDGGPAINARFNENQGARFDKAGNLYVPQCLGASVRKIDTSGIITTVAGNFTEGFSGDGGPATSAQLQCPSAVAIDAAGNLFIADYYNSRIREVNAATGIITTIAGNGTAAFSGDGGPAAAAEINLPNDVAFDPAGNLYIADSNNGRIRKIDVNGIISSAAGGFENAGSPGVNTPGGLASDAAGNMYFSDTGNSTVSEIFPVGTTPFPATVLGATATPQMVTLSNVGNEPITIAGNAGFTLAGNTSDFSLTGGTCLAGATLAATGDSCTLQISFKPTAAGLRSVTVSVVDSALNSPQSFTLGGTATPAMAAITWAAPASIAYGVPLSATQLDATAMDVNGAPLPGTFVYTPATGTVLNPGVQTLSVTFTPTDAADYLPVTATVSINITDVTLSSFTPNTAPLASPATTISITGSGIVATTVVQVNGTSIATAIVSPTTLTAVIPATDFLVPGTLQITLMNPTTGSVSSAAAFTVTAPALTGVLSGPPATPPGTQPTLTFTIPPYPVDLTATLTISLKSSLASGITDSQNVLFANGSDTYTFVIKAGTTAIPAIPLAAGTVAETITVTPTLFIGTVNVTPAGLAPVVIDVPLAVPQQMSTKLTRSGNQLTVTIIGFSNTREIASAAFHFVAEPGASLAETDISPAVDPVFTAWYDDAASLNYGSSFTYTQTFLLSDTAAYIGSVQVTLTNSVGVSTVETAQ